MGALALMASAELMAAELEGRIGTGDPVAGKAKSEDQRCQECHGADGNSGSERIPKHAGQYAAYLVKQLADFHSGVRVDQTMSLMAEDLTADDRADIAAYFAAQPVMHGEGGGDNAVGRQLFNNGDKARGLPACVSCHGENGKGRSDAGVVYPVIGGQHAIYLRVQLLGWKLGDRHNSPQGVMNRIAGLLDEDEIKALADYVSGL